MIPEEGEEKLVETEDVGRWRIKLWQEGGDLGGVEKRSVERAKWEQRKKDLWEKTPGDQKKDL